MSTLSFIFKRSFKLIYWDLLIESLMESIRSESFQPFDFIDKKEK